MVIPGLNVSRETGVLLHDFVHLLTRWNERINLVSRRSMDDVWTRHIADSAQLLDLCPPHARKWVDLGSGAGFPGMVVSILARRSMPELHLVLVESDHRKAAFLAHAAQRLDLPVTVIPQRAEAVAPLRADVLSARALAPLPRLLALSVRHLAPAGLSLFPKGARHDDEIASSLETWRFNVQKIPSRTDPEGAILVIEGIGRV